MALAECPACGCTFKVSRRGPLATETFDDGTYVWARPLVVWPIRRIVHECHRHEETGGDEAEVPAWPLHPKPSRSAAIAIDVPASDEEPNRDVSRSA